MIRGSFPWVPGGATGGATWESYTYDLTTLLLGDISAEVSVTATEAAGGPSLVLTLANVANAGGWTSDAGGLIVSNINGNLPGTAPGVTFSLSGFAGLDLTTDAVAVVIDADVSPLTTDFAGVFLAFYSVSDTFASQHAITGVLYSSGIKGYAYSSGYTAYYPSATDQHWIGLLLDGGRCRATRDASAPADPFAGTSIIVQDGTHTGTWAAEPAQDPNTLAKYRASNLGVCICGIGVGAMAGASTVTVRRITIYRLQKDAA